MSKTFRFLSGHDNWRLGARFFRRIGAWKYHVLECGKVQVGKPYPVRITAVDLDSVKDIEQLGLTEKWEIKVVNDWRITSRLDGHLVALGEDAVRQMLVDRFILFDMGTVLGEQTDPDFDEARRKARLFSFALTTPDATRCPDCSETVCDETCPSFESQEHVEDALIARTARDE